MTTRIACADCHHTDHHDISERSGKRIGQAPCFFASPGSADGFCPCETYRFPHTGDEFAAAYLGPEKPGPGHTWEGHDDRD